MQPIQFESVKSGDITQNLKQGFQTDAGLAAIDQANRVNQQFDQQYAPNLYKDLEKWSPKLAKVFGDQWQKRENIKKARLHTLHLQTRGHLLEAQRKALAETKEGMRVEHETVMSHLEQDETLSADLKAKLRKLSNWDQLQLDEFALQDAVAEFNPSTDVQLQNSLSREEYEARMSAMVQGFYEQFGDVDEAMVYENITVKLQEKQDASYKKWQGEIAKKEEEKLIGNSKDNATRSFISNIPLEDQKSLYDQNQDTEEEFIPKKSTTYKDWYTSMKGHYGSREATRDAFYKHMEEVIRRGGGNSDAIEALGEEEWEGTTLKNHPQFGYMITNLAKAQMVYDKSLEEAISNNSKLEGKKAVREAADAIIKEGKDPFENNFIDNAIQAGLDAGVDVSALRKIKYDYTEIDGKTLANWREEALQEAEAGTLTERRLRSYPAQIQNGKSPKGSMFGVKDWSTIAEDLTTENVELENQLDYFKKDLMADINPDTMTRNSGDADKLYDQMEVRIRELARENRIRGVENPYQTAKETVWDWYKNHKENAKVNNEAVQFVSVTGVRFDSIGKGGIAPDSAEHNNALLQLDAQYAALRVKGDVLTYKVFNPDNTPADHTPWFTGDELEKLKNEMGKEGWIPDARVEYLMDKTGRNYATVINEQLKTLNREELPPSKVLSEYEELSPDTKALLNQSKTEEEDQRALGSFFSEENLAIAEEAGIVSDTPAPKWNSSITYGGLSDQVQNASESEGMSPIAIAAMMDMIVKYPKLRIDTSKNPPELSSPNISNEELYVELLRERWKHSGGTDTFALRELQFVK